MAGGDDNKDGNFNQNYIDFQSKTHHLIQITKYFG